MNSTTTLDGAIHHLLIQLERVLDKQKKNEAVQCFCHCLENNQSSNCKHLGRVVPMMATENEENGTDMQFESDESAYSLARLKLESLLNKNMRIRMTDGRTLVGLFLCTDRDCNVILGSAQEFLKSTDSFSQGEPRVLGLAMIPGHHVVSIEVESESLVNSSQGM